MPRGKFVKIMLFSLLALALAVCVSCLALITAVKAGQNYPRVDVDPKTGKGYSSDAHTVCAIWLVVVIWLANALRSWRPIELQSPVIAFSIFTNANITLFGNFATFHVGLNYTLDLLKSILIGFAVASVVSLLVLPMTSRTFFLKNARDYALQVQEVLLQQAAFVRDTTENPAVWFAHGLPNRFRKKQKQETGDETNFPSELHESRENVRASMIYLSSLFSKLQTDVFYSKEEFAIVSGISMLPNILDMHIRNERHYQLKILGNDPDEEVLLKQSELQRAITTLQEHLSETAVLAATGIQYFLLVTKLMSIRHFLRHREHGVEATVARDEESRDFDLNPLEPYFVVRFEHMMHETFRRRRHFPGKLASLAFDETKDEPSKRTYSKTSRDIITSGSRIRLEFFLVLYMGHMQDILLHTTHELIKFADSKVADKTLKSYRVILPGHAVLKEWFSLVQPQNNELSQSTPRECREAEEVHFPDSEHMPPENLWENLSNIFRVLRRAFISEHSLFGLRVAAASFSIGILAFLHRTYKFFHRQRLEWIMGLIVIGMNPTTGETFFSLTSRIIGSAISVALCLGIWYAVDKNTAGIIILLYFANMIEYWFYVKRPRLLDSSVIAIVTLIEIIAAALELPIVGISRYASYFSRFEPVIGGKFPRKIYGDIISEVQSSLSAMSLMVKTTQSLEKLLPSPIPQASTTSAGPTTSHEQKAEQETEQREARHEEHQRAEVESQVKEEEKEEQWFTQLGKVALQTVDFRSARLASSLSHLSASVTNNLPLPPYLPKPGSFPLSRRMHKINKNLLNVRYLEDPAFSAFITLEVLRSIVAWCMRDLLR
ncbi:hypothetical protein TCE0_042r14680 [Talaromyces pinophilus]|uniref:Uncharacterized protein n=1 Tax=Talaromyces pinophilus TaxID=128442 RepID=A0A6V8HJQ0_TALPI|nr:hypothetical protein TCE0_042r14680 [Talaromyces pinophilus]